MSVPEQGLNGQDHQSVVMILIENGVFFFHLNSWQMKIFLNPLDALIPKIPISFFCRGLGPGHVRVRGSVSVGFWGGVN